MESTNNNKANAFQHKRQPQDKKLVLQSIVKQIEKGTGLTISELKKKYSEETLFAVALKHVTTGYFGVMTPPVSVKLRHFERSYNDIKNLSFNTIQLSLS